MPNAINKSSNRNKIIISVLALCLVGALTFFYLNNDSKDSKPIEPTIGFKENITFEQDQQATQDEIITKVVNVEISDYDAVVSINNIDLSIPKQDKETPSGENASYSVNIENLSSFSTEVSNNILIVDKGTEELVFNLEYLNPANILINEDGAILDKDSGNELRKVLNDLAPIKTMNRGASITVKKGELEKTFDFEYTVIAP